MRDTKLQTRIDVRSATNNSFSIFDENGEVVAVIEAVKGGRQNFTIQTKNGYVMKKPSKI